MYVTCLIFTSYSCYMCCASYTYRIVGKFGEPLNLVKWLPVGIDKLLKFPLYDMHTFIVLCMLSLYTGMFGYTVQPRLSELKVQQKCRVKI
jgi:hypothetical protein